MFLVDRLRTLLRHAPASLPLAVNNGSDVQQAHDCSDDRVCDNATATRTSQLKTETTIDHTKDDCNTADADVGVRHS